MTTRNNELEDFKRQISLVDDAQSLGYEVDPRTSCRNSICMKNGADKLFIGMGSDRHWIYWSVHDQADSGSIIDFAAHRKGFFEGAKINFGQVFRELRPWLAPGTPERTASRPTTSGDNSPVPGNVWRPEPVTIDLDAVRAAYDDAQGLEMFEGYHSYLCDERAIPAVLLANERFLGRVRVDHYGNAVFPHWNIRKQVCGFEKKNRGFTGFASGGMKGLWCSAATDSDRRMVIAETAIDALSYAALFGHDDARFFSTAGQLSPHQPALLNQAMQKMPPGSKIIVAVDHDDGGDAIAEYIEPVFRNVHDTLGRDDLELVVDQPDIHGRDWNDVLRGDPAS